MELNELKEKISLKEVLNNMMKAYITTKTVDGAILDSSSLKKGTDCLLDINKLLK
jgi:hypothetical protein